ncbi:hypothetical protein [Streptomyces californicus]|uniref:hypothetical protein n=1 Tax=Streptomyces californicus TaxID=67351 RepID=UPI00367F33BD
MADEHYEWLDKDAAEKLLRGEPVVPVGDGARTDARRLAEALAAAREGPRAPTGELPGEEAVLTAFRQAGHGTGGDRLAGRAAGAALPGRPGLLPAVHLGAAPAAPAAPPRRPRWSRPLRFGLVASLAGCALGGVAVAAGTGVFGGTFGGLGSPAPATSVSAAATPGPLMSDEPAGEPSSPADPPPPARPEASSAPETRESGGSEEPDEAHTEGSGREPGDDRPGGRDRPGDDGRESTGGGGDDHGGHHAASGSSGGFGSGSGGSGGDDTDSENWYDQSVKACKAFRDGTLDDRSRRRLIRFAKGEENLERFCDRLLDGDGGSGGHGGSGGSGGGNGSGGSGGGDDGDDGPGGGSRPPVSFHPVPRSAVAPDAGAATDAAAGSQALPEPEGDAPASVRAR